MEQSEVLRTVQPAITAAAQQTGEIMKALKTHQALQKLTLRLSKTYKQMPYMNTSIHLKNTLSDL